MSALSLNVIKVFAVVLLLLATTGLFTLVQRYEPSGDELLHNGNFRQGLTNWNVQGDKDAISITSDILVLENRDASRSTSLRQTLPVPSGQNKVMLVAEISTEGVDKGEMPLHKSCLYLVGRNREGKSLWKYPHMLTTLTGSNRWNIYSRAFSLIEEAGELVVGISLNCATSVMRVKNLTLIPVRERTGFRSAVYVLLSCWCVVFLWIAIPFFRLARPNLAHGLLAVVTVCIFIGVMIPGSAKEKLFSVLQSGCSKLLPSLSVELQSNSEPPGGKTDILHSAFGGIGHFTLFACLAVLLRKARPGDKLVVLVFYLMLFAATTEVLQFFAAGRGPRVGDWLIDVSGIAAGLVLLGIIHRKDAKGAKKNY